MLLDLGAEWWDTRRAGLVAHQAGDTIRHEAFLPAPNCRFAGVGAAHDFRRAVAIRREQDDLCPPNVLLWAVPIRYDRHKALAIIGFQLDSDTRTHVPDSHSPRCRGNPKSDSTVRFYPLVNSVAVTTIVIEPSGVPSDRRVPQRV